MQINIVGVCLLHKITFKKTNDAISVVSDRLLRLISEIGHYRLDLK